MLLRYTIITLTGIALLSTAVAQSTFMRMYNKGYEGRMVREVGGNSYVVAGGTDLYMNWHWHMLSAIPTTSVHLFKTNASGTLLWERIHNLPGERSIATWMEPADDGGFILAGSSNRDKVWPPDSNDVLVIKTDGLGNISWTRSFDTGKDELGNCVRQTADGGYIVSGFHDAVPMSFFGNTRVLLIKLDGAGNVQWSQKYELAMRDLITGEPFTYVVRQLADGGYAIVGTALGATALGVYVIRTDVTGSLVWAKVYSHDASVLRYSTGLDILENTSGELIVAGSMDKSRPMETNYPYWLRLNAAGDVIVARFFQTLPLLSFQSGFSSVIQTADGGFFFTGMGGYGEFGDQMQLLKSDADLATQWSRVYTWDGLATMGSRSGRATSDGGYVFTGKRQFAGTVLMKTNSQGLIPCKTPGVLIPLLPGLITQTVTPLSFPGIVSNIQLPVTTSPLIDVAEICPAFSPLPVELIEFTAQGTPGRQVDVKWTTATESGNDHFVIERSGDALAFEPVAWVDGAGNSVHTIDYAFTDSDPLLSGVSYYRLAQVDNDGSVDYSSVVPVSFTGDGFEVAGSLADASSGTLFIYIRDAFARPFNYSVTETLGRTVAQGTGSSIAGVTVLAINARDLSTGIYTVSITSGAQRLITRVVY